MLLPHGTTIVVTDGQKLVGELAKERTHDSMQFLEQALRDG